MTKHPLATDLIKFASTLTLQNYYNFFEEEKLSVTLPAFLLTSLHGPLKVCA